MQKSYNYFYLDPSLSTRIELPTVCLLNFPLYVGKGKNDRFQHGIIALREEKELLTNKLLYKELLSLVKQGHEPLVMLFNTENTVDDCLEIEGQIILALGRKGLDEGGILCNRAKGGAMPDQTGIPKSKEANEQMVRTRKKNGSYKTGKDHKMAKTFVLIDPTGITHEITGGLKTFCAAAGLSWQMLYNNANKGQLALDRNKHRNLKRLTPKFWNTLGWQLVSTHHLLEKA